MESIPTLLRATEDQERVKGVLESPLSIAPGLWVQSKVPSSLRTSRLWLEDWQVGDAGPGRIPGVPVKGLEASEGGVGVDLELRSLKTVVLQGDRGLSRKGGDPGIASYHYSLTRNSGSVKPIL